MVRAEKNARSPAPKKTPVKTPRNLGLVEQLDRQLEDMSLPALPEDGREALEMLGSYLVGLDKTFKVGRIDIFDRSKATLSYYQGEALTKAFNICTKIKNYSFGQWLSRYWDYSDETARICRVLYARFTLREVQALGYWNAYLTIKEENAFAEKATSGSRPGKKAGKGKGDTDDPKDKPLSLTLGTHVNQVRKHTANLLAESEALTAEFLKSPEKEGVEYRNLAGEMRGAMIDFGRSILALYKLACTTNSNHGTKLKTELKRAVELVKRMEAKP